MSCAEAAPKPCFNGCFPSPFLVPAESHDNTNSAATQLNNEFVAATSSTLHAQFTNHESLPPLHESHENFTKSFPQFSKTSKIDYIRAQEYHHLNLSNSNTCFDYTGFGLFSHAQMKTPLCPSSFDVSYKPVNLHSQILYGGHESDLELRMRERAMAFMNVSDSDYKLIFIANEVSAFKLVTDSFDFQPNGELLTVYDHKSEGLDSMIDSCKKQGVQTLSAEFNFPNFGMDWRKLKKTIRDKNNNNKNKRLFVFPIRSRVTGAPYSYVWMSMAQENGWHVLLDACSLRPRETGSLGLSMFKPDFMVCSFYKVFGENPSGFGCLFVKKSSVSALKDSGSTPTSIGIVSIVPAFRQFKLPDQEETETVDAYLERGASSSSSEVFSSSSLHREIECRGLDHADSVGLMVINYRTKYLINWLVNALMSLQHPYPENGLSLIRIYGPKVSSHRGPAVAFNIFDWKGQKVDPALVQKLAGRNNISLGNAFLQNVKFSDRREQEEQRALKNGPPESGGLGLGLSKKRRGQEHAIFVVTAALGFLTNFEDIYRLWAFVSRFLDADFVEKETWRYMALNQNTIDV